MGSFVGPLSDLFLFVGRKVSDILAFRAAAAFESGGAVRALDEEEVTAFIPAVGMGIGRLAALVTGGNDLSTDPFAQPVIEDEILSFKFIFQSFLLYGICIVDDAAFQVKDVGKALVQQVGAGFFATDAPCTVHDDIAVLISLQHVGRHWQLFAEGIGRYLDGLFEMANEVPSD